jgi:hypothetical protein
MIKTQYFNFNNIYSNNNESGPNCPVVNTKGVAMIFCWGGPDFKSQTDDR